jgi:hypothetical protein
MISKILLASAIGDAFFPCLPSPYFSRFNSSLQRTERENEPMFRFSVLMLKISIRVFFKSLFTGSFFSSLLFFKWGSSCMNSRD